MLILASSGPTVGGMELQATQQAEALSKMPDIEVCIIAADCFDQLIPHSVHHYAVNMSRSRRNIFLLASVLKVIKGFSPDLIHAHGHKAASLLSSLKPVIQKNIKLVATAHNVKRNNKQLLKMDEVFVVSKGIAKAVLPLKSHVVLNGIKPHQAGKLSKDTFCKSMNLDPSLPLILGVGRLVQTKRFEYLLNAAKGLNANIVICGDGPEYNTLKRLAPKNCILAGHRKDIRDLLYIADLMVISADRDGFSLALIEALHSGLPVLSTAVPGAEDLLPEECLIRNTATPAFHDFLKNHLKSLEQLRTTQQPLFEFARDKLHITQVAELTHSLYKNLLGKEKGA